MTGRPVTLFHLSDIHFGLEDPQAIGWAADRIAHEKPIVVAITGDLTMRARRREFAAALGWIQSLAAPVTVEVGNHDLPYFNLAERFVDPYRQFRRIDTLVEHPIDLGGIAIVPLKTTARAQPRLNWSKGWVSKRSLARTLKAIDRLPDDARVLVAAHHPLVEVGTTGTALTHGGQRALEAFARRSKVLAVLSGHIHDPFDLVTQTAHGPVRMIGAGTLSLRIRSTPASFNELVIEGREVRVKVRNVSEIPTSDMQIADVPEDATPPREPDEPVSAVAQVPTVDPPVH